MWDGGRLLLLLVSVFACCVTTPPRYDRVHDDEEGIVGIDHLQKCRIGEVAQKLRRTFLLFTDKNIFSWRAFRVTINLLYLHKDVTL